MEKQLEAWKSLYGKMESRVVRVPVVDARPLEMWIARRKAMGWSQADLAGAMGEKSRWVSRVEKGAGLTADEWFRGMAAMGFNVISLER